MPARTNAARAWVALLAAVLLVVSGCTQDEQYAPVKGRVTLDEKPLVGVKVWFFPTDGGDLPPATGLTDDEGVYQLTSNNGKSGAPVGKHRVIVNWPLRERGTDDRSNPPPVIPARYTQAADTPFQFDVKPGEQTINLAMKAK